MKKCLLAEADFQRRAKLRKILEGLNFIVLEAAGVDRALDCIRDHQPALVMFSPEFPNEDWRKIIAATINTAPKKAKIIVYGTPQSAAAVSESSTLGANATMQFSDISSPLLDHALHELGLI